MFIVCRLDRVVGLDHSSLRKKAARAKPFKGMVRVFGRLS